MNKNINKLSIQIRNIFFIIERLGMRMSDICSAKITVNGNYCLKKVDDNNYLFTHYQFKTHKTNTLSIDGVLAGVIEGSIEASREQYGHGVNYIFSKNIEEPIGEETFTYHLNKMCKENNILSDDGKLLRIKGHTFRRTMATDYANMGVDLNVIKILLGQSKIDVLGYYIKIHGDEMNRFMVDILKEDEELIDNIGNLPDPLIEAKMEGDYLPLSCGYCSKDIKTGICDHANKCYKCTMFVPMKSKLNLYKKQLSNVETNILVCKINGYERLLSINEELKESLEDIVYQLERGTYEKDGKNCRVIS